MRASRVPPGAGGPGWPGPVTDWLVGYSQTFSGGIGFGARGADSWWCEGTQKSGGTATAHEYSTGAH